MKLNRKPVFWGISAALLLGSTYSVAMTLGRVRGSALLGQPLDLSVLVQYSEQEELTPTCFEADVYYGDTPLESSRVLVSVQSGAQPKSQVVRISSNARVDDAVVRMVLRAKCAANASRQYVLLADVVSELADPGTVATAVARTDALVPMPSASVPDVVAQVPGNSRAALVVGADGTVLSKPAHTAPKRESPHQVSSLSVKSSVVRLDKGSSAKADQSLNLAALQDLQRRVDEIDKRQSSNTSADDVQKNEARTKALEADIRGLQLVSAKNQQNIQMVSAALDSKVTQDIGRPLVYGLGALLVGCLAALAFVAKRMRASGYTTAPWWSGEGHASSAPSASAARQAARSASLAAVVQGDGIADGRAKADEAIQEVPQAQPDASPVDTGSGQLAKDSGGQVPTPVTSQASTVERLARNDFSHSASGTIKAINTREMLDVRQQAEFFMALGQHDEAVRLLESSIRGSAECNPLVFLDLLKIFHTLSRRLDFERYREEFNAQFTGRIPPYATFLSEGSGLDAYEDICNQIVVLWPTDYTVDYIEQCLVRMTEDDPEQGIDLEAFKDLLMLHGVLKRLDHGYDSNMAPFSASRAEPSQSATLTGVPTAPMPVVPAEPSGADAAMDLDLDLDLGAVVAEPPTASSSNLIDFDVSGYISPKKPDTSR